MEKIWELISQNGLIEFLLPLFDKICLLRNSLETKPPSPLALIFPDHKPQTIPFFITGKL